MMYARNITAFLTHLIKDQKVNLNLEDEIVRETLLTRGGEIVQRAGPRVFQVARAGKVTVKRQASRPSGTSTDARRLANEDRTEER